MVNILQPRRGVRISQARRHPHHPARADRPDRRRRRCATRWRATRLDTTIDLDLPCDHGRPATTLSTTCSTPTPGSRRSLRNGADLGLGAGARTPSCSTHEKEGELLRALAEFPRVVAGRSELREPHRVARYLEDDRGVVPPLLRQLPGAADGRRGADRPASRPAAAGRGDPGRARQRARPARRLRTGPDVSPTHEAGWAHADGALRGRAGCARPTTPTRWSRSLWSSTARKVDGDLVVGGVPAARPGRPT